MWIWPLNTEACRFFGCWPRGCGTVYQWRCASETLKQDSVDGFWRHFCLSETAMHSDLFVYVCLRRSQLAYWLRPTTVWNSSICLRYDTIEEFNVYSKAKCGRSSLAHVTRNNKVWKEIRANKRQCPLSLVKFKIREGCPERTRKTMTVSLSTVWLMSAQNSQVHSVVAGCWPVPLIYSGI